MRAWTTKRILLMACALALPLVLTPAGRADTVDIVHDGFGAHGLTTFWGAGYHGAGVMAGVYMLNKTGDTGLGSTWKNGPIPGFCVELHVPAPKSTLTYEVIMPEDMYNTYTGEFVGSMRANYLRELWALYYDPAWASGSYTEQDHLAAEAFAAAVWEIIYEVLPASPLDWDVRTSGFAGGFGAEDLDWATANKWLHSLTGGSAKADLRVFASADGQNYLVLVPEPATAILLGLGGLCSVLGRRRRVRA